MPTAGVWSRVTGLATAWVMLGVTLGACASSAPLTRPGVIEVVGAESQYANVLAQIGGKYVHATAVLSSPFVDPHSFESGTATARAIADARLIVQNGASYDGFMGQLESATSGSGRRVIVVQRLVGAAVAPFNPHLWYDPSTMPVVASTIEGDLARILPSHAGYFRANLHRLTASLNAWRASVTAFRSSHSHVSAAMTEPVANYLLRAMGIATRSPRQFQADVMNGIDPSPKDIAVQENLLDQHRVDLFCYNRQVTDSLTAALLDRARHDHVPVVAVYETLPYGYTYQSWMMAETAAIEAAVERGTSTEQL